MGDLVTVVIFVLSAAVVVTMVSIVREVLPTLSEKERMRLRSLRWGTEFDRAIRIAWNEHARLFPHSWKRILLGFLFALAILLTIGYPLWDMLLSR